MKVFSQQLDLIRYNCCHKKPYLNTWCHHMQRQKVSATGNIEVVYTIANPSYMIPGLKFWRKNDNLLGFVHPEVFFRSPKTTRTRILLNES